MAANRLYFGDCLEVMRDDVADASVDLIYLDPPFNSKRLYNAFMGGAQWVAFDDTWRWHEAIDDFHDVASDVALAPTMEGLRQILSEGPNLAYLSYMANRLRECRRALKETGSIYLHCDPTMSHYLKVLMDAMFGRANFRNEVIWGYRGMPSKAAKWQSKHDVILFYTKSDTYTFHVLKGEPTKGSQRTFASARRRGYNANHAKKMVIGTSTADLSQRAESPPICGLSPSKGAGRRCGTGGRTFVSLVARRTKSASATRHRSLFPCSAGSSRPAATRAMWCSTRFVVAGPHCTRCRTSGGSGSASTSA